MKKSERGLKIYTLAVYPVNPKKPKLVKMGISIIEISNKNWITELSGKLVT